MKDRLWLQAVLLVVGAATAADAQFDPLPMPLSNNAVAAVKEGKTLELFSFMGIGAGKTWDSITNQAFSLDTETGKWTELRLLPGPGRIAASAAVARGRVYVLGGQVVDSRGGVVTVPDVTVYQPSARLWYRAADLPTPVGDAVVGVYRDRYLYVIGGRSTMEAVPDVQVYDVESQKWQKAASIAGRPVFGHAGAIVDDTIVYVDGAYASPAGTPKYLPSEECWAGKINHKDPTQIQWSKLPNHPGEAHYGIAAGASEKDHRIYFSGGTNHPYNFDGVSYDSGRSQPSAVTFAFNLREGRWETVNENTPEPTMDHRGLLVTPKALVIVGGMENGQRVTARVQVIPLK